MGSLRRIIEGKRLWIMQIIFCIYSKTLLFKDLNFINKSTSTLTSVRFLLLFLFTAYYYQKFEYYHYFTSFFSTFTESLLMFVALII
jgi:hypothetical protein